MRVPRLKILTVGEASTLPSWEQASYRPCRSVQHKASRAVRELPRVSGGGPLRSPPNGSLLSRPARTAPPAHHHSTDGTTTRGRPGVKGGRWTNRGQLGSAGTTFAMGFESRRQGAGGRHRTRRGAVAGWCGGCAQVCAGQAERASRGRSGLDRVPETAAGPAGLRRGQRSPMTGRGSASGCRSRRSCGGS
jgi:hypothetical protein